MSKYHYDENAAKNEADEYISNPASESHDADSDDTHNTSETEYPDADRWFPDIVEPCYNDGTPVFAGPPVGELSSYASKDCGPSCDVTQGLDLDDIDFPFMGDGPVPESASIPVALPVEKVDDRAFPDGHDTDGTLDRFLEDVLGVYNCYYNAAPGDSVHHAPRKRKPGSRKKSWKKNRAEEERDWEKAHSHQVRMPLFCHMRSYTRDGAPCDTVYPLSKVHPKRKTTESAARAFSKVSLDMKDSYLDLRLYERKEWVSKPLKGYSRRMCCTLAIDLDSVPGMDMAETDLARLTLLYDIFPVLCGPLAPTYIVYTGQGGVQLLYCFRQNIMSARRRKAFLKIQKSLTKAFGGDSSYVGTGYIRMPGTARFPKKGCGACEAPYILLKGPVGTMNWSAFCGAASAFLMEKGIIRMPVKHVDPSGDVKPEKGAPGGVFNPYDATGDKDIENTRAYLAKSGLDTAFFYTGKSVLCYESDPGDVPVYEKRAAAMRRAGACVTGTKPSEETVMARKLAVKDWAVNRLYDLRIIASRCGGRMDVSKKALIVRAYAAVIVNRGLTDQTCESSGVYRNSLLPNIKKQCQELNALFSGPLGDDIVDGIVECVFGEYDCGAESGHGHCNTLGDIALAERLELNDDEIGMLKNRYTAEAKEKHHSQTTMARREMNRTREPRKKGRPSRALHYTSCTVKAFFATKRGSGSHRSRIISYMIKKLKVARSSAYRAIKALEKLLAVMESVVKKARGCDRKSLTDAAAPAFAKAAPDSGMGFKTILRDNGNSVYLAVLDFATGDAAKPGWTDSAAFKRIRKLAATNETDPMPPFSMRYSEAAYYLTDLYRRAEDKNTWSHGYEDDVRDAGAQAIWDSMLPDDRGDLIFDWDSASDNGAGDFVDDDVFCAQEVSEPGQDQFISLPSDCA